jgi:hypothetical protein
MQSAPFGKVGDPPTGLQGFLSRGRHIRRFLFSFPD